ncbi:DUF3703 domain-containing protein [Marinobacter flavimaris]|jgi:hypothetical protein|uniref:DUF3703 domain-containing protein n=2 Tax=Marinobacter TaxID=2742 RepID=A0A3D8H4J0_9GAMM|nr:MULTISPECIES: DUF3703 domain-containing protein [Marinobacter]PPI81176.1 hypothetical protein MDHKLMBL_03610 [Marinobacter flavimaris]RCW61101.1 uncharacterized protein DUF3703 [Marinobacter nauticus]RDU41628.1 DUF3703 domain-containing protein [Marinobacter flavimaris]
MHSELKPSYIAELEATRRAEGAGDFQTAFTHLERAHILSQKYALAHAATHLRMLRLGWRTRDVREVLGQLTRTIAALVFSRIWVPVGNTGRANVSAFAPMPVPEDLAEILGITHGQ